MKANKVKAKKKKKGNHNTRKIHDDLFETDKNNEFVHPQMKTFLETLKDTFCPVKTALEQAELWERDFFRWKDRANEDVENGIVGSKYILLFNKINKILSKHELSLLQDIRIASPSKETDNKNYYWLLEHIRRDRYLFKIGGDMSVDNERTNAKEENPLPQTEIKIQVIETDKNDEKDFQLRQKKYSEMLNGKVN